MWAGSGELAYAPACAEPISPTVTVCHPKLPRCTSTHVAAGGQVSHRLVVNAAPLDRPTDTWPLPLSRPVKSALPSPLKSPVCTSTQVIDGDQVAHLLVL